MVDKFYFMVCLLWSKVQFPFNTITWFGRSILSYNAAHIDHRQFTAVKIIILTSA